MSSIFDFASIYGVYILIYSYRLYNIFRYRFHFTTIFSSHWYWDCIHNEFTLLLWLQAYYVPKRLPLVIKIARLFSLNRFASIFDRKYIWSLLYEKSFQVEIFNHIKTIPIVPSLSMNIYNQVPLIFVPRTAVLGTCSTFLYLSVWIGLDLECWRLLL